MPRTCTVCGHAQREAIELALVDPGESFRNIAARFSVSVSALHRHKAAHLPALLAKAQAAAEVAQADDLLAQVRKLQARALSILASAERAGDLRTALLAIREARSNLELLAKLLGELDERPQVNILMAPEWLALRAAMTAALGPYPDARRDVATALLRLEAGDTPSPLRVPPRGAGAL